MLLLVIRQRRNTRATHFLVINNATFHIMRAFLLRYYAACKQQPTSLALTSP
jgi:hypothetical protein